MERSNALFMIVLSLGTIAVIALLMFLVPLWRVWQQGLEGQAVLARAEQSRKVLVAQANAEKDSAVLRAEAIKIIGQASKEFPEYRQQEFIGSFANALESGKIAQIIYVPTEANIPIVEATRLGAFKNSRKE
jgi:regulator of protease activity HflC (stomatin/prohibitin superfamily)